MVRLCASLLTAGERLQILAENYWELTVPYIYRNLLCWTSVSNRIIEGWYILEFVFCWTSVSNEFCIRCILKYNFFLYFAVSRCACCVANIFSVCDFFFWRIWYRYPDFYRLLGFLVRGLNFGRLLDVLVYQAGAGAAAICRDLCSFKCEICLGSSYILARLRETFIPYTCLVSSNSQSRVFSFHLIFRKNLRKFYRTCIQ